MPCGQAPPGDASTAAPGFAAGEHDDATGAALGAAELTTRGAGAELRGAAARARGAAEALVATRGAADELPVARAALGADEGLESAAPQLKAMASVGAANSAMDLRRRLGAASVRMRASYHKLGAAAEGRSARGSAHSAGISSTASSADDAGLGSAGASARASG